MTLPLSMTPTFVVLASFAGGSVVVGLGFGILYSLFKALLCSSFFIMGGDLPFFGLYALSPLKGSSSPKGISWIAPRVRSQGTPHLGGFRDVCTWTLKPAAETSERAHVFKKEVKQVAKCLQTAYVHVRTPAHCPYTDVPKWAGTKVKHYAEAHCEGLGTWVIWVLYTTHPTLTQPTDALT